VDGREGVGMGRWKLVGYRRGEERERDPTMKGFIYISRVNPDNFVVCSSIVHAPDWKHVWACEGALRRWGETPSGTAFAN
jgi:hypothetical protein